MHHNPTTRLKSLLKSSFLLGFLGILLFYSLPHGIAQEECQDCPKPKTLEPISNDIAPRIISSGEGVRFQDGILYYSSHVELANDVPSNWTPYHLNSDQQLLYLTANEGAIIALLSDGSIMRWGDSSYGGAFLPNQVEKTSSPSSGTPVEVDQNKSAFSIRFDNGDIWTLGGDGYGGDWHYWGQGCLRQPLKYDHNATKICQVDTNQGAFAALLNDGVFFTWGNRNCGGGHNVLRPIPTGRKVREIVKNDRTFTALLDDNSFFSWGDAFSGGNYFGKGKIRFVPLQKKSPKVKENGSIAKKEVIKLIANHQAFAALMADGTVFCWGDKSQGGSSKFEGETLSFSARYDDYKAIDLVATERGFEIKLYNATTNQEEWTHYGK